MRRAALVSSLLLLPVAGLATAGAAKPPKAGPQLTAEPLVVQPGESVTLEGRGFPRNVHVALMAGPPNADATRIGGALTGRRGRFTATIRIRQPADPGALVAFACYDACSVKASVRFRIVAPER